MPYILAVADLFTMRIDALCIGRLIYCAVFFGKQGRTENAKARCTYSTSAPCSFLGFTLERDSTERNTSRQRVQLSFAGTEKGGF
jgi:hypothetical protein